MNTTHKFSNKLRPISIGILLALGADISSADIILTFRDNATSDVAGTGSLYTCNTLPLDFQAGREFRMCDPTGNLGGGFPVQKDHITGGETWTFDASNNMSATAGMSNTAGIVPSYTAPYPGTSADPTGGPALDQGSNFFSAPFSFLAPLVGSNAGNAYGTAVISLDPVGNRLTINFPVIEAQWGGVWFPLGQASGGITLTGDITNIQPDVPNVNETSFDFVIAGEEVIDVAEDPNNAGFSGWSPQWLYAGTGTAPSSIFTTPPPSPIASTGTLSATTSGTQFDDGRLTLSEIETLYAADTGSDKPNGITNPCSGGCFDFTVTGISGSPEEITLPLTSPIPDNPVYRK